MQRALRAYLDLLDAPHIPSAGGASQFSPAPEGLGTKTNSRPVPEVRHTFLPFGQAGSSRLAVPATNHSLVCSSRSKKNGWLSRTSANRQRFKFVDYKRAAE